MVKLGGMYVRGFAFHFPKSGIALTQTTVKGFLMFSNSKALLITTTLAVAVNGYRFTDTNTCHLTVHTSVRCPGCKSERLYRVGICFISKVPAIP